MVVSPPSLTTIHLSLISWFSNVCHFACVCPSALKRSRRTKFDMPMLFFTMWFTYLSGENRFMLISGGHISNRSILLNKGMPQQISKHKFVCACEISKAISSWSKNYLKWEKPETWNSKRQKLQTCCYELLISNFEIKLPSVEVTSSSSSTSISLSSFLVEFLSSYVTGTTQAELYVQEFCNSSIKTLTSLVGPTSSSTKPDFPRVFITKTE